MSPRYCCVVNCKNTTKNSTFKFYTFPTAPHKLQQRQKWIAAVKRINADGSPWVPKKYDYICSNHFIGNKKGEEENSPSYVPKIFPSVYLKKSLNETTAANRHARFMKRRMNNIKSPVASRRQEVLEPALQLDEKGQGPLEYVKVEHIDIESTIDQGCQVTSFNNEPFDRTFICNRIGFEGKSVWDVEIQTNINEHLSAVIIPNRNKFKDEQCGARTKNYVNVSAGPNLKKEDLNTRKFSEFAGYSSIQKEEQLLDFAGVTFENFNLLLNRLNDGSDHSKLSKENRLLLFLMKIKTDLTFSAIAVLFDVDKTTVSRVFFAVLKYLSAATQNLVFWPKKSVVMRSMPECFKPNYKNTRVIIDCTEFRIRCPSKVDNRTFCYSNYKKGFTAKLLIGITPSGFISFKSKVAGGKKSDSQLTEESGLIDLLEEGDVVLADNAFPQIKEAVDAKGKKVTVLMPPFLEKKSEFSKEETEATHSIANLRIHVERVMQRLRDYKILDTIPEYLFDNIDNIIHICCVLTNLQPPTFGENDST